MVKRIIKEPVGQNLNKPRGTFYVFVVVCTSRQIHQNWFAHAWFVVLLKTPNSPKWSWTRFAIQRGGIRSYASAALQLSEQIQRTYISAVGRLWFFVGGSYVCVGKAPALFSGVQPC